jgi:peptidoglycan LD-endopeptidase LytH
MTKPISNSSKARSIDPRNHRPEQLLLLATALLTLACGQTNVQSRTSEQNQGAPAAKQSRAAENPCVEFDRLNASIRDGRIEKRAAQTAIAALAPKIRAYFYAAGGVDSPRDHWVFPLQGYGSKAIGGVRGEGYLPRGYDYFDGNKHGGHPAHDIFILDKNQDEKDDRTGAPVAVTAMRNGVVVAAAADWAPGSGLRGGKYIYLFDPSISSLIYYAHNGEIFVKPGDLVQAGQKIAIVGRTGKSAAEKRSPTHLHLMQLVFENGTLSPHDLYKVLLAAGKS